MLVAYQVSPVVVRVVEEPTRETSVADILMGAVGMVGIVLLAALVCGLVFGWIFFLFRKARTRVAGDSESPSITAQLMKIR